MSRCPQTEGSGFCLFGFDRNPTPLPDRSAAYRARSCRDYSYSGEIVTNVPLRGLARRTVGCSPKTFKHPQRKAPTVPDTVSDDALRMADRIILVDPNRPGWYQPLYVNFQMGHQRTVEISVNSTDAAAVQEWRDHIRGMNLDE